MIPDGGTLKEVIYLTDPRDYKIENQLDIGIRENLYLEGELARMEMGYSPTEYYDMAGTREHVKTHHRIPLSKSDLIAINRLRKEKASIISNEENKKMKAKK